MINFTVGPVKSSKKILKIGGKQTPYFRTNEFSAVMKESENLMIKFVHAPKGSRTIFLTGSGTASMEAAISNLINKNDKALVVNGGSFGKRFVELLSFHKISFDEIKLDFGKTLTRDQLFAFDGGKYTVFLVNLHETSTGTLYDINLISEFCKKNNLLLIVDAISEFLAEDIDMGASGIDVLITGSQKALSCAPGISITVLSEKALGKLESAKNEISYYLNYNFALSNQERGQTPFTPAVTILLQINERLREIESNGGVISEINKIKARADYFRSEIAKYDFGFKLYSDNPSNAVTSLYCEKHNAYKIFETLKDEYGIWICPNGGELKEDVFRVGHIGELTIRDYKKLISSFKSLKKRGLL